MTRYLILVRHSQSEIDEEVPAASWSLSAEGRRRCVPLAQQLIPYEPAAIVTSTERKAQETGEIIGAFLQTPVSTNQRLHEHDRRGAPFLAQDAFLANVRALFQKPDQRIFGQETGREALIRFTRGIDEVISSHPQGNLVVVTHGTVLTLFVASHSKQEPYDFWQKLGQPAFVIFGLPDYTLAATTFTV